MSTEPDIRVSVGGTFTTATVNGKIVAVKWGGQDGFYYVADGTGQASKLDSERAAIGRLMTIAMNASGGGAASVITGDES